MKIEHYLEGLKAFRANKRLPIGEQWQVLEEDKPTHGFDGHYIYHTAWAARKLAEYKPTLHFDVSSQLQFVTIASGFVPMHYYEYRVPTVTLSNLVIEPGDVTNLPMADGTVKSLSCMHTIEHIGLGRYGDPIDPDGDQKAAWELTRVLAPRGRLLMVAPVGKERVVYNAHRIYSYGTVRDMFASLKEVEFSLYSENDKKFYENADPGVVAKEESIYGACGMWVFEK